ncbi:MAG: hypothetical protein IPL84_17290 [Chitinophagaceae bacterium]|nr:hypothetical protein [Chitinophagaceae bacterium]
MKHQKSFLAGILFTVMALVACDSNEIGDSKDVNQDKIFMDYELSYNQSDEQVELDLQYRFAGPAGTTLVLNYPSRVELDGENLVVDSSEGSGAYYETKQRFSDFIGNHTIRFADLNNKKLENSFDFSTFTLHEVPATASRKEDLHLYYNLRPLGANDFIEIKTAGSDSSFSIKEEGPGNRITIPAAELARQNRKILTLECTLYRDIPLSQTTSEGGSFKMIYRLKPVKIKLEP